MNNGIKYFINFGRYTLFSEKVIGGVSVVVPLPSVQSSINDVVDDESGVGELIAFDSVMNKNATNSTSGTTSIKYKVIFGVKPTSINAA